MDIEEVARIAVDCGYKLHKEVGPGLLEWSTKFFWQRAYASVD